MKKKIAAIIAAAAGSVLVIIAAVLLLSRPGETPGSEVPEFVLPENSSHDSADSADQTNSSAAPENTSQSEASESSEAAPDTTSEVPAVTETTTEQSDTTPSAPPDSPETQNTPNTQNIQQVTDESTASSTTTETSKTSQTTATSTQAATTTDAPVEILPDNVLVTSCDPLHYIRFEFQPDRILFSGMYDGDKITDVHVINSIAWCDDLTSSGSSFSGSIDTSLLQNGYHIIQVSLSSATMNYVFETTEEGARILPGDNLPAEKNLRCADNPLELPVDGVLQHITASGNKKKAAEILRQIQELSDEICAGITNDFDKARALSDWVSQNIYYDHDAAENGVTEEQITLEYILLYHRSVCFGWSNLYSALCQAQGIKCFNASGSVVTGSRSFLQTQTADERSHSWNMVIIDGQKIWVDTVWNSTNSYKNGRYRKGSVDFKFFGITNELLAHDHRVTRFEYRDYFSLA